MSDLNRRRFLSNSANLAAGVAVAANLPKGKAAESTKSASFASGWHNSPDRIWLGPEYWANPMQDWRIADGRIECVNPALNRNVHLLTRQLGPQRGKLRMSVRVGRAGGKLNEGRGSFGFSVGISGPLKEYRNSLIFGSGLNAGVTAEGGIFVGNLQAAKKGTVDLNRDSIELRLLIDPDGKSDTLTFSVHDFDSGEELAKVTREGLHREQLVGNIAVVANFGTLSRGRAGASNQGGAGTGRFWFAHWQLDGNKLDVREEQAYGPILFSQYTLSGGILKLTAQMPPIGDDDSQTVQLEIQEDGKWRRIGEEPIHPEARTATFRIENWDAMRTVPFRLTYDLAQKDGTKQQHEWTGTIRRDPVDQPVITVADVSCNIHAAFPNHEYVANMAKLDPDLLAFVGDQFYESTGGYGVVRTPVDKAIVDYLRKWAMHGWTWRELMRDRPSISIPDDHDVYQGNIWGESGAPQTVSQEAGGYQMDATWVNVVHRTQTSHHPDPYDPTPVRQNISAYYGPLTYGRISFAVIADRMFKTAPEGEVPPTGSRADHVIDPNFDPKTADLPGLELLGERQLQFLEDWASDWRGADMKGVISQTIFTAMATTHGSNREVLRADYDANGWPQAARNEALRAIRKAFAVHLAGDQHLPAVVHYGVDEHNDAGVAFAGPAVNVGYPRWWEPKEPGRNRQPDSPEITGEFLDHFGNPLTVLAVANGAVAPRGSVLEMMREKSSGLGVVRFDKPNRKVIIECWPFLVDPTEPGSHFPGWPVEVDMLDNYGRRPVGQLPTIKVDGLESAVIHVVDESNDEVVYSLRLAGTSFQPHVFANGTYTVRVSNPDAGKLTELKGLEAKADNSEVVSVRL